MKFLEILQNPDGSFSSRRVFGISLILTGAVGWFMGLDATLIIGLGTALLGVTTFDKAG